MTAIVIVPYDPGWPAAFEKLAGALRACAGSDALRIDHIGSTAVPGLTAKDIIDVQITVPSLTSGIVEHLEKARFRYRRDITHDLLVGVAPNDPALEKRFFQERPGERRANIHVRVLGRTNQRYPLLFRDYLRASPEIRAAYQQIKEALAGRVADDGDGYYAIKDPVMDIIYRAAELWAERTGWQPDLADAERRSSNR